MELCEMRGVQRLVPEDSIDGKIFRRLKVFRSVGREGAGDAGESSALGGGEGGNVRVPPMEVRKGLKGEMKWEETGLMTLKWT